MDIFRQAGSANALKCLLFFACIGVLATACGDIKLGPGSSPNDPVPTNATVVASSTLTGLNGKSCSGAVSVYQLNDGSGTYTVHLAGISVPSDSPLQVVGVVNGAALSQSLPLRFTSGTQNYSFVIQVPPSPRWNSVNLHNSSANLDYCIAQFQ
jgi:hypothetical protein